jgi:short-subunit dehydrogenase
MAKITLRSAEKLDRPHWLPRSAFPFQIHFADIDGKRIHYIDEGSGPALLLVSAGQWSFVFRDVILRLRGQLRCLALDFPGSGLSPDAQGHDHSVRANAQILEGFIDALDLQDITMAVHDAGGPIGFLVAAGTRTPTAPRSPLGGRRGSRRPLAIQRALKGVNQMSASNVLGKGRTALVTGASRGIGTLIAHQVASQGGHVVLTGRSAADLKAVTSELAAAGADVSFIPADLTQPGAAETLAETVERQRGGIDLLVNNAGGDPLREFHAMTIDENLRILQLNLLAPVALSHAALDGMLRRGRGHIVNISAMAGRVSFPYTEAYAAAKDGLIGFTRVLRSDYHARGVSASVLILGAIRGAGQGQRMLDESGMKASGFMAPAESVARAVVKAVTKDRVELVVMPGPGRLLRAVMDYFPALGAALNRAAGASTTMQKIIDLREAKSDAAA